MHHVATECTVCMTQKSCESSDEDMVDQRTAAQTLGAPDVDDLRGDTHVHCNQQGAVAAPAVAIPSLFRLSEAEYGKVPTSLQKGRLYNRNAEARVQIDDIPNGVEWKDQPAEWWMEHGATVATRFLKIFSARGGGGGAMTDQMIKGKVLRTLDCGE